MIYALVHYLATCLVFHSLLGYALSWLLYFLSEIVVLLLDSNHIKLFSKLLDVLKPDYWNYSVHYILYYIFLLHSDNFSKQTFDSIGCIKLSYTVTNYVSHLLVTSIIYRNMDNRLIEKCVVMLYIIVYIQVYIYIYTYI